MGKEAENRIKTLFDAASPTGPQQARMLQAIRDRKGENDAMKKTQNTGRKAFLLRTAAAAVALCLCCALGVYFLGGSPLTLQAYAMETGEEITSASLNSGHLNDDGSMEGVLFYLESSDREIERITFTTENQYLTVKDWSETGRDQIWRQQSGTVEYGANRDDYNRLVYYWDPYDAEQLLTGDETVADLPEHLRHDTVTLEAKFADGKTLTRVLNIVIQDNGDITINMVNG